MGIYLTKRWCGRRKKVLMVHQTPVFFEFSRWEVSLMTPFFTVIVFG